MRIISTHKQALAAPNQRTFTGRCRECDHEFESPEAVLNEVECHSFASTCIRDHHIYWK